MCSSVIDLFYSPRFSNNMRSYYSVNNVAQHNDTDGKNDRVLK
jgi:hypothetical protein